MVWRQSFFYDHRRENLEFGVLWQTIIANNEGPRDPQTTFIRESTGLFEMIVGVMLQTVWNELDYCVDFCRITKGAHIEHL